MNTTVITNTLLMVSIFFGISVYALDIKIPFPQRLVIMFHDPASRIMFYFGVYLLSFYNPIISMLALVFIVLLHSNDLLLLQNKNKNVEKNK